MFNRYKRKEKFNNMEKIKDYEKDIHSEDNIVEEAYEEILDRPISKKEIKEVTEEEIEQANALLNPDPNTLDRG